VNRDHNHNQIENGISDVNISFWDDWLREPEQRKDRVCIRPEISRTYTFGKIGASNGQYFEEHLKYIVLNKDPVNFLEKDLSFLLKVLYLHPHLLLYHLHHLLCFFLFSFLFSFPFLSSFFFFFLDHKFNLLIQRKTMTTRFFKKFDLLLLSQ